MNREILFRGQRLDTKQWVYGNYNNINGKAYIFPEDAPDSYDNYQVDPATVGQYTGCIDKNGKKIFEGDILYPISKRPYLVFWDEENVKFALKNSRDFCLNIYQNIADEYIVIGNIHDNPDRLKGGQK